MKTARGKQIIVGVDFAEFSLKEAVKGRLQERGWTVTDLTPDTSSAPMYHRVGFILGVEIAEGEFGRALAFCGIGMEVHIAASKVSYVHVAVCETVPSAK